MSEAAYRSLTWEAVEEGDVLPPFEYELSLLRLVAFVRATGLYDFVHFDDRYAQSVGAKAAFIATPHVGGLFTRLVTDWAGPQSLVRNLVFRMTAQCLRDDLLTVSGRVGRKYRGTDGSYLIDVVDLNIATPTTASAAGGVITLDMPSATGRMPVVERERGAEDVVVPNEDMPDFARAMVNEVRVGSDQPKSPLEQSDVHLWCEALEDWNPLYWDEVYAAASPLGGIVAPPAGLFYGADSALNVGLGVGKPGADVPAPIRQGLRGQALQSALREELIKGGVPFPPPDCPETVVTQAEFTPFRPLRIGDTLRSEQRLLACSPRRQTRLGSGYFTKSENLLFNQHGALVKRIVFDMFCYRVD